MNDCFDVKDVFYLFGRWLENVFKGNLMLQFSWLKEFQKGKVSGR